MKLNGWNRDRVNEAIGVLEAAELALKHLHARLADLMSPHAYRMPPWDQTLINQMSETLDALYAIRARDDAAKAWENEHAR